jgi:integrase
MTAPTLIDAAGRRRSPATMPGYYAERAPRNKGRCYPADPPTVEEIVAVMRKVGTDRHGARLRRVAAQAGIRRRLAPHQLRHAHALELARERVPLNVIQRQLGHRNLGTTSVYLQGIDAEEIIATIHGRRAPMMLASVGLKF